MEAKKAEWVDGADYIFETEMQDDFTTDFDTDFKGEYSKEAMAKYWKELHEKCIAWRAADAKNKK
jgi:hypothetical protein